jgi:hypothetical protein
MKASLCVALAALVIPSHATPPHASGTLGIYAIVERVVLEPNDRAPERLRLHGAFAFVNGGAKQPLGVSPAIKGVLSFNLPAGGGAARDSNVATIKREWSDLKSVAGTGEAVGFGAWFYFGQFGAFRPDGRGASAPQTLAGGTNDFGELRVTAARDSLATPTVLYQTNVGVVKLNEASHASVIAMLRAALR